MYKQEALQKSQMDLTRDLALNTPVYRVQAALDAGFDPISARRLAGSSERVIYGNLDRPIMHVGTMEGIRQTNHLNAISSAMATFKNVHNLENQLLQKSKLGHQPNPQSISITNLDHQVFDFKFSFNLKFSFLLK